MRLRERLRTLGHPRLLVVTAVNAERDAFARGLGAGLGDHVTVSVGGVGSVAAAAFTARALVEAGLAGRPYAAAISAGIAGGFAGRADVGATVLGTAAVAADLGAEAPDGFLSIADLDFGQSTVEATSELYEAVREKLPEAVLGAILSVSTVTGTATRAEILKARHPDAVAEAMEGFGVATAAQQAGVAFAEVRTVSNLIGPRDRAQWRITDALIALEHAGSRLASLVS